MISCDNKCGIKVKNKMDWNDCRDTEGGGNFETLTHMFAPGPINPTS